MVAKNLMAASENNTSHEEALVLFFSGGLWILKER